MDWEFLGVVMVYGDMVRGWVYLSIVKAGDGWMYGWIGAKGVVPLMNGWMDG